MKHKMLYVASTVGHLKSFHIPYLERFAQEGWIVHTAGKDGNQPLPGAEAGFDISFEKSMFSPKNLNAIQQLSRLLKQEDYDVVSVHTSLAAFFTRLAVKRSGKRPLVINTVHGYLFDQDTPAVKKALLLGAEKLTAHCTDLLLTMNRQDTAIALEHHLCQGEIIQTDGMGVRFEPFVPADQGRRKMCRKNFGIPEDAFVLVYAAEFSGRKNQASLIRAIAKLPPKIWLLLAGRGGELEECRTLARALGVEERVVFAGFIPDVESCYHAADLCISTSRSEGLPFNLMEAMHCALPVIATNVKGHEDLVLEGKNGFLVPFGDEEALCRRVEQLMEHPEQCRVLGAVGRERVERYALEPVLEANMRIINAFFHSRQLVRKREEEAERTT